MSWRRGRDRLRRRGRDGLRRQGPDRLGPDRGLIGCGARGLIDWGPTGARLSPGRIAAAVASSQARFLPTVHVVHIGRVQCPDPT